MPIDPFISVLELSQAYRSGRTTARDTIDTLLTRIEVLDSKLGAFQVVYANEARMAADAADLAIKSGHSVGPFHGIPFALKDIIDVRGRVTTGGSKAMSNRISPTTAAVAKRLISAGGILVGKTKTVEVAMGGWGTNQYMGTPWNPWDLNIHRTPGGSSSGSGVAVASGMVPCAIGTDTGGSVRTPAAWNGIVGLKVTEGYLNTAGIIPYSHTLDTPGPMVRSVADAAFLLDILAGHEAMELSNHVNNLKKTKTISGLKLGVLGAQDRHLIDQDILELYDSAVDSLASLGATICQFHPPISYEHMAEANGFIFAAEGYTHHRELMENTEAPVDEGVRSRILGGKNITASQYIDAILQRKRDIVTFKSSMQGFAGLLLPTLRTAAIPVDEVDQNDTPAHLTRPFNYLAMCALSLPMGLTENGLPAGLQIAGRGGDEATILRIGEVFEKSLGIPKWPDLGALLNE